MKTKHGLLSRLTWGGIVLCLLLGLLLPASLANLPSAYANGAVTVSIDAPAEVAEGSDFIAKVAITDVENFDIAQFDVTYNNTILHVTDVTAGDIAGTAIPIDSWGFIPPEQTPPDTGTIRVIANVPGAPGVSGSGYLAEIHFHVVGSAGDTSDIIFSNGLLGDNEGHEITPVTWANGSVHVSGAAVTYTLTVTSDGCCTITVGDLGTVDPGETEVFTDIPEGTSVELTATDSECCIFDGWTVDGSSVSGNPITITIDANHSATATSSVPGYTLTVDVVGNGDVIVNGETPASYPATYEFACGTDVSLEAIAADGWYFANWSGDLSGSTNPTTITMNSDKSVTAEFAEWTYTFQDPDRGTALYINTDNNTFQFTGPGYDSGIVQAHLMMTRHGRTIILCRGADAQEPAHRIGFFCFADSNRDICRARLVDFTTHATYTINMH